MKQFKFALIAISAIFLFASCEDGTSKVENTLVVEQVEVLDKDNNDDCMDCSLDHKYNYRIKFKSSSGKSYYYTDYKHEVGDTLVTASMFVQQEVEERADMKNEIARLQKINDSLVEANITMKFQYDLMLQFFENKVVPAEIEKSKKNLNE